MKEIIVIDNNQHLPRASYYVAKDGHYDVGTVNYATPETILNENRIVAVKEQVPETFEELKELCEDLESKNVFIINAGDCIEFNGLYFWKDGSITTTQNNNDIWATKTNLTPARQWQIIKSLIGEE